jgi:hypothetical protein
MTQCKYFVVVQCKYAKAVANWAVHPDPQTVEFAFKYRKNSNLTAEIA